MVGQQNHSMGNDRPLLVRRSQDKAQQLHRVGVAKDRGVAFCLQCEEIRPARNMCASIVWHSGSLHAKRWSAKRTLLGSPANEKPRIEPRNHWPRRSPCALPLVKVKGKRGQRFVMQVRRYDSQSNLPIVALRRVGKRTVFSACRARGARQNMVFAHIGNEIATTLSKINTSVIILTNIMFAFSAESGGLKPPVCSGRKSVESKSGAVV